MQDTHDFQRLHAQAYDAFDDGRLREASALFAQLLESDPTSPHYHYMQGLVHKYLRDWSTSLLHNQRSLALREEFDESSHWNAGIAATAMGDWQEARAQWTACGIRLPPGEGPVDGDFGVVSIRLNPWAAGETLFARRIDVVRARLLNVPLPESGHRCGDIVLHDGARTGTRDYGGHAVPVFNALARLEPSASPTFVAFVRCESAQDIADLQALEITGVDLVEDWTGSIVHYCLRCSHGAPHVHDQEATQDPRAWQPERNLGIAARAREDVDALLGAWLAQSSGRHLESIQAPSPAAPEPEDGHVWWSSPQDDEDTAAS
jgi:hypothetical protein